MTIHVIDSHTAGEPTRVVVAGGPELTGGNLQACRESFRKQFDAYRRAIVCEPRGSDAMVGALLCPPTDPACVAGVIFFNNVGYLGMCGHGAIGVAVTLGHLGRITSGQHALETPVGTISLYYDGGRTVRLENVASYRYAADVRVVVEGVGEVRGDIAWGGNWFFLVHDHQETLELANVARLTAVAQRIQTALHQQHIYGAHGAVIDHVELFGPPSDARNHGRNFVLCPGGAYDRSPCGTGTSAKIACLAAEGKLAPGAIWRQEGILGTVFEGSYRIDQDRILPSIQGQAFVTAEAQLIIDDLDPFAWGVTP